MKKSTAKTNKNDLGPKTRPAFLAPTLPEPLLVKTNKILNLLKLESIIYTTAMQILYLTIMFSYIQKIQKVEYLYIAYSISAILLLLYAVINIKRTLLIRKELRNNNSK